MHRLADDIVAAKGKTDVAYAAADLAARANLLDLPRGLDEIDRVVVVLLHPSRDGENVRIKNDLCRLKSDLFSQQLERPLANTNLIRDFDRLPLLVKGHHHHR